MVLKAAIVPPKSGPAARPPPPRRSRAKPATRPKSAARSRALEPEAWTPDRSCLTPQSPPSCREQPPPSRMPPPPHASDSAREGRIRSWGCRICVPPSRRRHIRRARRVPHRCPGEDAQLGKRGPATAILGGRTTFGSPLRRQQGREGDGVGGWGWAPEMPPESP
jgi:hypothetical protein